ncbi:hypothetical protein X474_22585 [Dethiosulfatarculus sandiegensis]|uniref:Uncharacterized protein n=1 Tax=Dethiosulfatarculus sandiegensis TaxID=1429043 RepID=A0A0D2J0I2_9BACT|nr:hypothetical protein X474_22585 [Dethiosulfatarculus sandiegensis]
MRAGRFKGGGHLLPPKMLFNSPRVPQSGLDSGCFSGTGWGLE